MQREEDILLVVFVSEKVIEYIYICFNKNNLVSFDEIDVFF